MINKAKQVHIHVQFIFISLLFHNLKDYIDTNRQGSTLEWFIKIKALFILNENESQKRWKINSRKKRNADGQLRRN